MTDVGEHIRKILENEDVIIEDIRVPENTGVLKVFCDTEEGITSDRLVSISKKILNDPVYDADYAERYDLEVSSPGIRAHLTLPRHFRKNTGREVELRHNMTDIKSPLKGKIINADNEHIQLEVSKSRKNKEIMHIPFKQLEYAVIKLKW
jgi:ribosome maturation factor RimP